MSALPTMSGAPHDVEKNDGYEAKAAAHSDVASVDHRPDAHMHRTLKCARLSPSLLG
jgi:hypothetical protein